MPEAQEFTNKEWRKLGFERAHSVMQNAGKDGSKQVTIITAFDLTGYPLPYFRLGKTRRPPFFIIVDGVTVAMDQRNRIWYCKDRIDLRKYRWPRLDEHTRNP